MPPTKKFKIDMTMHTHRIRTNPNNENSKGNIHPNSLLAQVYGDPVLKKRYRLWEREYFERSKELEWWYEKGCHAR